jgi:hypothetical protein
VGRLSSAPSAADRRQRADVDPASRRSSSRYGPTTDKEHDMAKVVLDTSISIDGFVAGENDGRGNGLGDGGDGLHAWLFDDAPDAYRDELFARTGAIVASRKVYDITRGWKGKPI